jgi:antitoxin component YwqK of YwqJK toxin-antitoxin module
MHYLFILSLLTLFISCNVEPNRDEIIQHLEKHDFSVFNKLPSCNCSELEDQDGKLTLNNEVYTGTCFSNYPNIEVKYEEQQLFEGELYGYKMIFSPSGDTLSKNEYKQGKVIRKNVGINETCNCEDLVKSTLDDGTEVSLYYDMPFTGICKRFFPPPFETKVYLEAKYKNGKLHGTTRMFDKNENLIYKEKYFNGIKQ